MANKKSKKDQLINVSQFKAEALRYIADTEKFGNEYVITRRGIPVARVVPVNPVKFSSANSLQGLMQEHEDIVSFDTSDLWEALK